MFSLALCSLQDEYIERLSNSPPELKILFDFSKSQEDLIKYFTEQLWTMGDKKFDLGVTLSAVLFNFMTYDPFSRRSGKEISEEYFINRLKSQLEVIATSKNNQDIELIEKRIKLNTNGMIKSTKSFDSPELLQAQNQIEKFILSNSLENTNKEAFLGLFDFFSKTILQQQQLSENLEIIQYYSKELVDAIIYTLVLATFQPNLDPKTKQVIRLRILEMVELLRILSHFEKLDNETIAKRNYNLMKPISEAKEKFNIEFMDRNKAQENPLDNRQIEKTLNDDVDFIELIMINFRDRMKNELNRLRRDLP